MGTFAPSAEQKGKSQDVTCPKSVSGRGSSKCKDPKSKAHCDKGEVGGCKLDGSGPGH